VHPTSASCTLRVEIKGAVALDRAGNVNTPSGTVFILHDWEEPVQGFDADGLWITGGTMNNFEAISEVEYR